MSNFFKDRPKTNLVIDAIMLVLLMAMTGMGLLIKLVLVHGEKRNIVYGNDVDLLFLGLTRHQWGSIHLILSLTFIALLLLHIILHWKMIKGIFEKMLSGKGARTAVALVLLVVALFFALVPFFVKPEIVPFERKRFNERPVIQHSSIVSDQQSKELRAEPAMINEKTDTVHKGGNHEHSHEAIEVYGYMTLREVSDRYALSVNELADIIDVPADQADETIGRLKRRYGFEMEQLRDVIIKIKGD